MPALTQDTLQDFSDRVANICEEMEMEPEQMLQAIGSTLVGAVMSFGQTDYALEIEGVATVNVDTIFEKS